MQDLDREIFDVVDENDAVIGRATRRQCHEQKHIHRSVMFFLIDGEGRALATRRSEEKDTFPGYWSVALGGHVDSGEDYDQAVRREALEEAGEDGEPVCLGYFKKRIPEERENVKVYCFQSTRPPALERQEVQWGEFRTLADLKAMIEREPFLPETPDLMKFLESHLSQRREGAGC